MQDAFNQEVKWLQLKLKILDMPVFSTSIHKWLARKKHFSKVLECGTGAGDFIHILEKIITFDELLGFDVSTGLVLKASETFAENKRMKFITHDLHDTSKAIEIPNNFDLITGLALLEHTHMEEIIPILKSYCNRGGFMYFPHNYMSPPIFEPTFDTGVDTRIIQNFDTFSIENKEYKGKIVGDSRCGAKLYNTFIEHGMEVILFDCTNWLLYPKQGKYTEEEAEILRMMVNFFYNANKNPMIPVSCRINDKILEDWKFTRLSQIEENKLVFICPQTSILVKKTG